MLLPAFKQITRISPSAFKTWEMCQNKTYLTRLAGHPYIQYTQGKAAAVGSAFDAYVKDAIIKTRGECVPWTLKSMLKANITTDDDPQGCINLGKDIAIAYTKIPLFKKLCEYKTIDCERELFVIRGGIPLLGQIDAIIPYDIPLDWKLRGFGGCKNTSPHKGYHLRYQCGTELPPHLSRFPMEKVERDWALQLLFYNWVLNKYDDYRYVIHEVLYHEKGPIFVEHEGIITEEFSNEIRKKLEAMWEALNGHLMFAEIERPRPRRIICEAYNVPCAAIPYCLAYQQTLGDPTRRENF